MTACSDAIHVCLLAFFYGHAILVSSSGCTISCVHPYSSDSLDVFSNMSLSSGQLVRRRQTSGTFE